MFSGSRIKPQPASSETGTADPAACPVLMLRKPAATPATDVAAPRRPVDRFQIRQLGHAFQVTALSAGDRAALVTPTGVYTYRNLLRAAYRVRDRICAAADFQPGDRVLLWLNNGPEYAAAFYGTLLAGGVAVPVPPDVDEARLDHILSFSGARLVLTNPAVLRRRASPGLKPEEVSLDASGIDTVPDTAELPGGNAPAAVFFTSGSSGRPKGVTLSHENLLSNAESICQYLSIDASERALGVLPFYHAFGNSVLQSHLLSGAAIILTGSMLFPETLIEALRDFRATSLSGVPDVFRMLLMRTSFGRTELPDLRYVAAAGGRLDPDQADLVARRAAPAKLFIMYGQTEATARLSFLPPEMLQERRGSIGRGIPGVELQVVDSQGKSVAPGDIGEIRARGPNVMLGYWNDPEATASVLREGWLSTGDLATVDADGFIYPKGRRTGFTKIAGHRVHPGELEEFIRQLPSVLEAVAVPCDGPAGTRFALFVQPWNGTDRAAADQVATVPVTEEGLRSLCAGRLPRHLVPATVEVVDRFPLNSSFKVDRQALERRAAARQANAPASEPLTSRPVR